MNVNEVAVNTCRISEDLDDDAPEVHQIEIQDRGNCTYVLRDAGYGDLSVMKLTHDEVEWLHALLTRRLASLGRAPASPEAPVAKPVPPNGSLVLTPAECERVQNLCEYLSQGYVNTPAINYGQHAFIGYSQWLPWLRKLLASRKEGGAT